MADVSALMADAVASRLVSALQAMGHEVYLGPSKDIVPNVGRARVTDIQRVVAGHFNITVQELTGLRRYGPIVRPRHLAMWLSRYCTDLSFPEIGRAFNRDHTSVIYAVEKYEKHWCRMDPNLAALGDKLKADFVEGYR
jgi:chromosomal replication initiation ATPase DnaA